MKGKFLFVVGLGVGYVLGTRAGRERYEQIRSAAERVWNQPTVQDGVQTVKGFAMSRVGDVSDAVLDGAKKLVRQVSGTQATTRSNGSSTSSGSSSRSSSTSSASNGSSASKASSGGSAAKSGSAKSGAAKSGSAKSGSGAKSAGGSGTSSSS